MEEIRNITIIGHNKEEVNAFQERLSKYVKKGYAVKRQWTDGKGYREVEVEQRKEVSNAKNN